MIDIEKYKSIPYLHHGRSFEGIDCYGLVLLIFKEECGIVLKDYEYTEDYLFNLQWDDNIFLDNAFCDFVKLDPKKHSPQLFDAPIMRFNAPVPNHVGIVLNNSMDFIHAIYTYGVAISQVNLWQRNIHGIYRHKELI